MGNTSPAEAAGAVLEACLGGVPWPEEALKTLLDAALAADPACAAAGSRALFAGLVEPLADRFAPSLCPVYADIFARAIARAAPGLEAAELTARYGRIRRARRFKGRARRIAVLSRVTLGADVAVTSVVLDGLKRRFPEASIVFAGTCKAWELFEADPRLEWLPVDYGRGATLRGRLAARAGLTAGLAGADVVVDPDSRLTQLGLLPVCPEANYYFFESRAYGGNGDLPLPELTRQWMAETFNAGEARAYIAPREASEEGMPEITVSLGVGENPAKRVADPFESGLLRGLLELGGRILIDRGAGGEERERVDRAMAASGAARGRIGTWDGAFAPFAARIARSRLYVGYDSAGQHVAAACGIPLVSVFNGFVSERMFSRWRPDGAGPLEVIRMGAENPERVLEQALACASRLYRA